MTTVRNNPLASSARASLALLVLIFGAVNVLAMPAVESRWTHSDVSKLKRLYLGEELTPRPSPSNSYADDPKAAGLGKRIFFDKRFSANGALACASCHQPEHGFTDGRARSRGLATTMRNAPTVISAANYHWFYWDGRRDSLWSQALIPFEAADEMGSSRVALLHAISSDPEYRQHYEGLFGSLPDEQVLQSLPPQAGPLGNLDTRTAWYRIAAGTREQINRFYANIGKSVAAYERTLRFQPTRFDRFAALLMETAETSERAELVVRSRLLSAIEIEGLRLYLDDGKTHCRNCHNGKLFSNSEFYDINSGRLAGSNVDYGRAMGIDAVISDTFNCRGPYSDVAEHDRESKCKVSELIGAEHPLAVGAFKTPTLRGLAHSAPYFHDGSLETLEDVMDHYMHWAHDFDLRPDLQSAMRDAKQPHATRPLALSAQEQRAMVAFLLSLSN